MDILYYMSGIALFLGLPVLLAGLVILLARPHLLNRHPRINSPVSRGKIATVGLVSILVAFMGFGSVLAATEPVDIKRTRIEQEAALIKAEQLKQQAKQAADLARLKEIEESKPVVKTELKTEVIVYESIEQNDGTIPLGQKQVSVQGVNGERSITYEVTYVKNVEKSRKEIKNEVSKPAVKQVTKVGTYIAPTQTGDGYINAQGNYVQSPSSDPTGATAECSDGTYSYSQSRRGTCSHHGGVARWL